MDLIKDIFAKVKNNKLKKLTINRQFQLGFSLLLIFMILISGYIFSNTAELVNNIEYLNREIIPAVEYVETIDNQLADRIKQVYGEEAGLSYATGERDADQTLFNELEKDINELKALISAEETVQALNHLENQVNEFESIIINLEETDSSMEQELLLEDLRTLERNINTTNEVIQEYSWNRLDNIMGYFINRSENNMQIVIFVSVVALLISVILGFIINKSIAKVTEIIQEKSINAANKAEVANESAQDINNIANTVEEKVNKSNQIIKDLLAGNNELSQAINEIAKANQNVSAEIEDLSSQAKSILQAGKETSKSFEKTDKKITNGNEIVYDTVDIMKSLQKSTGKISDISNKIMEIADQTNLLALNAAIEAARVGEAGSGFAVVAEEIKDLANESMQANQDVKEIIEEIETETEKAVNAMVEGDNNEASVVGIFAEINELSKESIKQIENVINYADKQVFATTEVEGTVQQISASSQEVSAQAEETLSCTEKMESFMNELTDANNILYTEAENQVSISKEQSDLIKNIVKHNKKLK